MINEECVKELYHMAVFDEYEEKECRQMNEYYMWDYVGKELVKSFFSGTISFALMVGIWILSDVSAFMSLLKTIDIPVFATRILVLYIGFLAVYLFLTAVIYSVRYVKGRKKLRSYVNHFKKVCKIYKKEEKLKS